MLDAIDTAFLARWRQGDGRAACEAALGDAIDAAPVVAEAAGIDAPPTACDGPPVDVAWASVDRDVVSVPTAAAAAPQGRSSASCETPRTTPALGPPPAADAPLVERLLAAAWADWNALAACVEDARSAGRRVIAVAGSRPGEGRTTLVACLAAALRARGRDVVCTEPDDCATAAGAVTRNHDRRIVLLDAGVWFPPGPLHRQRLMVSSLGVDAAILVRRSDTPGGTARRAALEALGVEVLGEVLTFTPLLADGPLDADHDGARVR